MARLAVEGLTRKEIAGQLFITENSVKTHLEHIYGKLGVRNRLQMEHKLTPRRHRLPRRVPPTPSFE